MLNATIPSKHVARPRPRLNRRESCSPVRSILTGSLLVIYLWGVLGDVVVTAAHALEHLLTQTASSQVIHHHFGDSRHSHGHSHGRILDQALANVGKKESRDDSPSRPPLRLSRSFEHLSQPNLSFDDLQITSSQIWFLETSILCEISHEPLIPPPEIG